MTQTHWQQQLADFRHEYSDRLLEYDDLWFYIARSKVTSDFIVDRLEQWWQEVRLRFLSVKTLVINLDKWPFTVVVPLLSGVYDRSP
jgi:hypothetical protein